MIRREYNNGWILITQYDHAVLAGSIMSNWGNERFSRPEPLDEVLFAVREHDCGWKSWDSSPKINPENGYPANFMEMEPEDQSGIWSSSYESHSKSHPYASSLIALHFARFNQKILSREPSNDAANNLKREINEFVADNLDTAASGLKPNGIPEQVKINLRIVQIGDIISLSLCHGWDSMKIAAAPINYKGETVDLKLESKDGFNYVISPYPFSKPLISCRIMGKRLDRKSFASDRELRRYLESARTESLDFTIRKG
ncbi:MAG: DUF3891 family protein [Deltaproteobacteria bacterium]